MAHGSPERALPGLSLHPPRPRPAASSPIPILTPPFVPPSMTTPSGKVIPPRQRKIALLGSRSVGEPPSPSA